MRLVTRLVREAWQYGGCGIQIAEMKHKGILVRHFFPLHNPHYQTAYRLDRWARIGQMFSIHPFFQVEAHVVKYFGESVGLYFVWIRKYTLFLRYIAFAGLVCGILDLIARINDTLHDAIPLSLVNMSFSIACSVWGVAWIFKWKRTEADFALRYGQEAQVGQELVRDEFHEAEDPTVLDAERLYRLKFTYPLTIRNRPDGSMLELYDNNYRRLMCRFFVSYPVILILSSGMLTLLYFTTLWRFKYPDDGLVTYGSSAATVIIGFLFGVIFDKVIEFLNGLENNRTDTEMEEQRISKSFLFYFMSYYFALFTIALWPSDISDNNRLDQLASQMLVITLVKPMVQNITELGMPYFKSRLRIHTDLNGGSTCAGLCSLLRCSDIESQQSSTDASESVRVREGRLLWKEAQMEPYESTSGDYLEITLQYGYMTMFAATFPWASVAAFLYNLLEIRIDARKILRECQRPLARPASSIGAWNGIFVFLSALSVITNGYLITIMSPAPKKMGLPIDEASRYKIFTVAQYILVAAFFAIYAFWSGHSEDYGKIKSKHHILSNKSIRERIVNSLRMRAHDRDLKETV